MKRIRLIIVSLVSIILITGCTTTKKAIKSEEFAKICNDLGIEIVGVGNIYDYAEEAYKNDTSKYNILYVEGKKLSDITGMFNDDLNNTYRAVNGTTIDNVDNLTKKGKNWKSYEISKNGVNYYLIYVDNTYLYLQYKDEDQELMNKLKDAMKY